MTPAQLIRVRVKQRKEYNTKGLVFVFITKKEGEIGSIFDEIKNTASQKEIFKKFQKKFYQNKRFKKVLSKTSE